MQSPTLFLLIVLWIISLKTRYAGVTSFLVFVYIAINCLNIFRIYPFHDRIDSLIDTSSIKVGDVISTHQYLLSARHSILHRLFYTAIMGDLFFHTVLVVNYNNKKYILHANLDDIQELRPNASNLQKVGKKGDWYFLLEPLESFLEAESIKQSIIRVSSSGKVIDFRDEIIRNIEKRPTGMPIHCCYFIGRYLEDYGILKNKSALADSLYFIPKLFSEQFSNVRYFKL